MYKYLKIDFQAILRILFFAIIFSGIASCILYFSSLSETYIGLLSSIILALSVFLGGMYAANRIHHNGLIQGFRIGLIFFVLMFLFTLLLHRDSFSFSFSGWLSTFFLVLVAGGLGGLVGVRRKKKRKVSRSSYSN